MVTRNVCLKCGASLGDGARLSFCSKCLFLAAGDALLDPNPDSIGPGEEVGPVEFERSCWTAIPVELPASFGDYELLEEIGRGGMGVVYRARQRSLDRVVAIKMMTFGPHSSPDLIKRFQAEAVAAASLHHPNIVAIHEVGVRADQHFFVMDHIGGQNLAKLLGNFPLAGGRAAGYLKTVAEAIHYAHERGILHRDLKPSNVLIDRNDQPHVVDFGLARRLEGDSELTLTGQVLGSPNYLSPEQASAGRIRVSRRTDVYALGATLYQLLTGRPPFQAESLAQTLDLVLHTEPVSPRLLNPGVHRDLETICLKCLEKEPGRRYSTAQELAEELGRFFNNEPIRARPLGTAARTWRWCRRNPALAGTAAVAVLAITLGFAGVTWQLKRAEAAEGTERQQRYAAEMNLAQQALNDSNLTGARELLNRHQTGESETDLRGFEWSYLWQEAQIAAGEVGWMDGDIRTLEVSPNGEWLAAGSDPGRVRLWNLKTSESFSLTAGGGVKAYLTFSPDSQLFLFTEQTSDSLGTIVVWDTRTRRRLEPINDHAAIGTMAFSPNGQWFGYGMICGRYERKLVLIDFTSRQKLHEVTTLTGFQDIRHGLEFLFTTDGRSALFSENEPCCSIEFYDFLSGGSTQSFPESFPFVAENLPDPHPLAARLRQSARPFDAWLAARLPQETKAVLGSDGVDPALLRTVILQALNNVMANASIHESAQPVSDLDLSSQTRALLSLNPTGSHRARLNRLLLEDAYPLEISRDPFPGHREAIIAMAAHPNGRILATGAGFTETTIRLWALPSFRPLNELSGHKDYITALRFSPDGQTLASAGADRSIRLWDTSTGRSRTAFAPLPEVAWRLCFTPDGRALFSGASDGWIHRWPVAPQLRPGPGPWRSEARFETLTVGLDTSEIAGIRDGTAWIGEIGADIAPRPITALGTNLTCLLLAPKRRILYTGSQDGEVQVWSLDEHKLLRRLSGPAKPVGALEQDRHGRVLLVARGTTPEIEREGLEAFNWIEVWDTTNWQLRTEWSFRAGTSRYAVSPDARYCAVGNIEGPVYLWRLTGGAQPNILPFPRRIRGVAFSPDGRLLAASSAEGDVRVWEMSTLEELRAFRAHTMAREMTTAFHELSFSPDGRRLATVGEGAIKLWDVATWRELIEISRRGESLQDVFFSADGQRLTARNSGGDVLSWRVPSFDEIAQRENQRAQLK